MNLKTELLKSCIFILIGVGLCAYYSPDPEPQIVIKESIKEVKSGQITRHITHSADGLTKIDEVETYLSNKQSNVSIESKVNKAKNVFAIIPRYNIKSGVVDIGAAYSYNGIGLYGSQNEIGLFLSLDF